MSCTSRPLRLSSPRWLRALQLSSMAGYVAHQRDGRVIKFSEVIPMMGSRPALPTTAYTRHGRISPRRARTEECRSCVRPLKTLASACFWPANEVVEDCMCGTTGRTQSMLARLTSAPVEVR